MDLGAAHQRAMHGTAVSDLQQPGPLRVVEIPAEGEDLADAIEVGRGVLLAPVAVVPMHPPVGEVDADRKVRLLQQGLLLESGVGADAETRIHPLVKALLDRK